MLVFAKRCAHHIKTHIETITNPRPLPEWDESFVTESNEEVVVTHNWDEVRRLMWDYVGIVRSDKRLMQAATRINILKQEIKSYYASYKVTADLIELRHLVEVAGLMIRSASMRLESRGLHFNLDHPQQNDLYKKDTIVQLNQQRAHSESLVVA